MTALIERLTMSFLMCTKTIESETVCNVGWLHEGKMGTDDDDDRFYIALFSVCS